jgi:hypothetical protein
LCKTYLKESTMFDPVTDEVLRRRRMGLLHEIPSQDPRSRTALVCSVCGREMSPEEKVYMVAGEVHCGGCHDMLDFELGKERQANRELRDRGTRWDGERADREER